MTRYHAGGLTAPSGHPLIGWNEIQSETIREQGDGQPIPSIHADERKSIPDLISGLTSWPIRDQGSSQMCVAYAVAACLELQEALEMGRKIPSRLSAGFLYWASRQEVPDPDQEGVDQGCISFGGAVRALRHQGICSVTACPDALGLSTPSDAAREAALKVAIPNLAGAVRRFPGRKPEGADAAVIMKNLIDLIMAELFKKRPVALGFPIYRTTGGSTNWNDAGETDGTIRFPFEPDPASHQGGHAVCIVGFRPSDEPDAGGGFFRFRNSNGSGFDTRHAIPGVTGYGYGRVSISDVIAHTWGVFTLRKNESRPAR